MQFSLQSRLLSFHIVFFEPDYDPAPADPADEREFAPIYPGEDEVDCEVVRIVRVPARFHREDNSTL